MTGPTQTGERSIAAFLVAALAFSPPLLSIFSVEVFVFGLPLLYLYLFAAWVGIIAVVAWVADLGERRGAARPPEDSRGERAGTR